MAKIYIVAEREEWNFRLKIERGLLDELQTIIPRDFIPGKSIQEQFDEKLSDADVIIILFTPKSLKEDYFLEYLNKVQLYLPQKLIIPILLDQVDQEALPAPYRNLVGIRIPDRKLSAEITKAISIIKTSITKYLKIKSDQAEEQKQVTERIQTTATIFIEEALTTLRKRENNFKWIAYLCYFVGLILILGGVLFALWNVASGTFQKEITGLKDANEVWADITYHSIKNVLVIILLIASAKYSFNLGKAYMNESLKNSDRIHAIAFGKFYLQVYNSKIEPSELKDIFRDWNIMTTSSFIAQNTNDFDPAIIEKITALVDKFKFSSK